MIAHVCKLQERQDGVDYLLGRREDRGIPFDLAPEAELPFTEELSILEQIDVFLVAEYDGIARPKYDDSALADGPCEMLKEIIRRKPRLAILDELRELQKR